MKKTLLLLFALLSLGVSGAWAYSGIKLTFSRVDAGSGTATNAVGDVTVNVTDTYGNALPGITATLASTTITELKTGSAAALGRTSNSVLAPNAGYANSQNSTIEYTFCVTGVSTDFAYKYAALDVYALTGGGAAQGNSGNTQREWTFDISTGTTADGVASFISQSGNDICTVTDASDGLYHKNWEMTAASEKAATATLYVKVVLTKTDSNGCYAGLAGVTLSGDQDIWESRNGWVQATNGVGPVSWFGMHTPGDASTMYSLTSIKIMQQTGSSNNDNYMAVARVSATSTLKASDVVAISDNHLSASQSTASLETYNFSDGVNLLGGTTYYIVFLSSNTPTDGSYPVRTSRLSVNHTDYSTYTYGCSSSSWWPYFKATLNLSATTGYCVGDLLGGTISGSNNWTNTWTSGTSPSFTLTASAANINHTNDRTTGGLDIRSGQTKKSTYTITAPTGKFITGYKLFGKALSTNQTVTPSEGGSAVTFTTNGNSICVSGIEAPRTTFTLTDTNNSGLFLHALEVDLEDIPSVTSTSGLSNTKKYNIINNRGWWAVNTGETELKSTTELSLTTSTSDAKQQFAIIYYDDATNNSNDGYYLYSVSEGKFAYKNGTKLSLSSLIDGNTPSKVTFASSTNDTYNSWAPLVIQIDGNSFGVHPSKTPQIYQYSPYLDDGGNAAAIYETGSFDATDALAALEDYFHPTHTITYIVKDGEDNELYNSGAIAAPCGTYSTFPEAGYRNYFYTYTDMTPVTIDGESETNTDVEIVATHKNNVLQYTADDSSPIYYNLNIRSKYLVYDDSATGDVTLEDTSSPFNPDAAWAFIGSPYGGFKVINQTNGKTNFLTYTSVVTGANYSNNNIGFVASGDFTDQYWLIDNNSGGFCMRMKNNTSIYFHHDIGSNFLRTCSYSEYSSVHNDVGSTLTFASDEGVLQALYDELKYVYFGSNIGQYTWGGSGTAEEARANINSAGNALSYQATSMYKALYDALLDIKANITLNTPSAGYYRLKNKATDKYLTTISATDSYLSTTRGIYANGSATSAATVIRLVDSEGHLYMYNQSYGCGWVDASGAHGGGVAFATSSPDKYVNWFGGTDPEGGQIAFAICYGNGTGTYASYLTKGIYTADTSDEAVIGGTDYTADAAQWIIEEATTATIPMNEAGDGYYYATGYWPFDVTISNATPYALRISGSWAIPTALTDNKVPAGTPVLLKGTNDTATATINTGDAFSPFAGTNLLTGTYTDLAVTAGEDYFLGIDEDSDNEIGFYKWDGTTLKANRAYFTKATVEGSGIKGFAILWDELVDGIKTIENGQLTNDNAVYNLAGQRMSKLQRGVNIVNGKKVVVK